MADPQDNSAGTSVQSLLDLLQKGATNPHQQAGDLVNLVQLMDNRRQAAVPNASLLKYMVPDDQQYHPGFEPGGLIDALAHELGINPTAFDGMRQSKMVPLSMFTGQQGDLGADFSAAKSLLETIYGSPIGGDVSASGGPTKNLVPDNATVDRNRTALAGGSGGSGGNTDFSQAGMIAPVGKSFNPQGPNTPAPDPLPIGSGGHDLLSKILKAVAPSQPTQSDRSRAPVVMH